MYFVCVDTTGRLYFCHNLTDNLQEKKKKMWTTEIVKHGYYDVIVVSYHHHVLYGRHANTLYCVWSREWLVIVSWCGE